MSIFQPAPKTNEELEACAPLKVSPTDVAEMDEAQWYAEAYRGETPQLTIRAVLMGSFLGFFLAFTNLYIGLKTGWHLGVAITACILSYSIWQVLLKAGFAKTNMTILENNCMQSTASAAGYSTGGTFVSAIAALFMIQGVHLPNWVLVVWTIFLAICFVMLGALVMHKSGQTFSNSGGVFAGQLIELYTANLGDYAYYFIAIAAFTTMFSTTITTLDASPRTMTIANNLLFNKKTKLTYWFWILVLGIGTYVILRYFRDNMGLMVKIATVLSFLTAPFYAILNYILITGKHTPEEHRPGIFMKILSISGIVFLLGFSAWFLMNY